MEDKIEVKKNGCKEKPKKISIMIGDLECSEFDSEIFSDDGEALSLTNLKLPEIPFGVNML
jgi:hypothetical protein